MKTTRGLLKIRARPSTAAIRGFLLALVLVTPGMSQEKSGKEPVEPSSQHPGDLEGEEKEGRFPEIEAVASNEFRSVSYVQPLFSHLHFEGHFFNVEEARVGQLGASWEFHLGKHVVLSPGFGLIFGERQTTAPSFTLRWEVEKDWFVAGGLLVQAFRKQEDLPPELEAEKGTFSTISDGNHLSVRWKRLEIGPSWERIHYREGNEWKRGCRSSFRVFKHVSAVMFALWPETEVRGGLIIHPAR